MRPALCALVAGVGAGSVGYGLTAYATGHRPADLLTAAGGFVLALVAVVTLAVLIARR